jgi:hypothetical protein
MSEFHEHWGIATRASRRGLLEQTSDADCLAGSATCGIGAFIPRNGVRAAARRITELDNKKDAT